MKLKSILISVAIALGVGALSSWISGGGEDFYATINMPPLSPPSVVFPIVWGILYVLMGWAAARVFDKRSEAPLSARDGLAFYAASLLVNFFWSIFFFNFRAFLFSFVWLLFLEALILGTIVKYRAVDKKASLSQIPYALWVAFAGYLNLATYLLNR